MIKWLFIIAFGFLCIKSYSQEKNAKLTPNVIFILVDDMGWNDLSCYGNQFIETPNIDLLAKQGVKFINAYSSSPVCSPSRAALLTGKNPAVLNITDWLPGRAHYVSKEEIGKLLPPALAEGIDKKTQTVASVLKSNGYYTGCIGKWHLGDDQYLSKNYGFDFNLAGYHQGSPASYYYPYSGNYAGKPYIMTDLQKNGVPGEYLTDRLTTEANKFITQHHDKPFFLLLSHYAPHIPIQPKSDLLKKYQLKASTIKDSSIFKNAEYAAMVESVDISLGNIRKVLDQFNIAQNTIIIFTSDNGGVITNDGPHTPASDLSPLKGGKGFLYEGGLRVPAIVYAPHISSISSTSNLPIITTDWLPTILKLCNSSFIENEIEGINIFSHLHKNRKSSKRSLFFHYPHYSNQNSKPSSALIEGYWKLIKNYEDNSLELYNLKRDASESHNLVNINSKRAKKMEEELQSRLRDNNAKLPTYNTDYKYNKP